MSKKGKKQAEKTSAEQGEEGLTGVFSTDFPHYCILNGLIPIPVRQLPRDGAPPSPSEDTPPPPSLSPSPSPSSSRLCVMIDPLNDTHTIKSLHIRNMLVNDGVMSALSSALVDKQVTSMILWNVGLNRNTISSLISLLTACSVRQLVLDGNQIPTDQLPPLLQAPCLEQLSLKCCYLGDAFCAAINPALARNQTLMSLDLSSNQITDEGVGQLANALRINRTLLSLCLAGNRIGDSGVRELCRVLVRFPLTREEEDKRRLLLATTTPTESTGNESGRSPSGVSPDKSGRGSRGGKGKKEQKKEDKEKSGRGSAIGKSSKGSKVAGGKKGSAVKGEEREDPPQSVGVARDPLVDLVREEGGRLLMAGNTTLAHLTLSCNRIGERGVASLLDTLHTQRDSSAVTSDPVTSDLSTVESTGTGLLRVTLQHNLTPANSERLAEMMSLMRSCDPLATPTSPSPKS